MSRRRENRGSERVIPMGERLPPHSNEAEQGVLGCCLLDPKEALGLAMERIGSREVFYDLRHQSLFQALAAMVNEGVLVDPIMLQTRLRERQQLEPIGGMPYIAGLMNVVPSAANLDYYLEIVMERFRLRRVLEALTRAQLSIWDWEGEVGALVNRIETMVLAAGEEGVNSTGVFTGREVMGETVDLVERCFTRGAGIIDGVRTGFSYLDKMMGGLHNSEMGIIAARPSTGKTALMMNIALNAAKRGDGGGIFSVEMKRTALMMRALCAEAGVNMQQIRTGFGSERDLAKMASMAPKIAKLPLWFNDTAALEVGTFRAMARRMKRLGARWIMVDYLQLMRDPEAAESRSREREVAAISGNCKACAKELDIPVMVLAQLSRDVEKSGNRKPMLSDLRESGAIEQDADWVGMLYRPKRKGEPEGEDEPVEIPVNMLVAKQRNGPTGDCEFLFHKERMQFVDKYAGTGKREGELTAREILESPSKPGPGDEPSAGELFQD